MVFFSNNKFLNYTDTHKTTLPNNNHDISSCSRLTTENCRQQLYTV